MERWKQLNEERTERIGLDRRRSPQKSSVPCIFCVALLLHTSPYVLDCTSIFCFLFALQMILTLQTPGIRIEVLWLIIMAVEVIDIDLSRLIQWTESGHSINTNLRESKEFHNPSLLTGLINMVGIKEKGSNIAADKKGLSFLPSDHSSAILAAQTTKSNARSAHQLSGKRTHIDFVKREPYSQPDPKRSKR